MVDVVLLDLFSRWLSGVFHHPLKITVLIEISLLFAYLWHRRFRQFLEDPRFNTQVVGDLNLLATLLFAECPKSLFFEPLVPSGLLHDIPHCPRFRCDK